jgi:hypothetical protein
MKIIAMMIGTTTWVTMGMHESMHAPKRLFRLAVSLIIQIREMFTEEAAIEL